MKNIHKIMLLVFIAGLIFPVYSQTVDTEGKLFSGDVSKITRMDFIGSVNLVADDVPQKSGLLFGGLSSIAWDFKTDSYYTISDDKKNARMYRLDIDLSDAILSDGDVSVREEIILKTSKDTILMS